MSHAHPRGICSCVGSQGSEGGGRTVQPSAPTHPKARIHRLHPALTPHCLGVLQGMGAAHARSLCAPSPPPTPLHCSSNPALHPWDSKRYQQLRVLQPGGGSRDPTAGRGGGGQQRAQRLQRAHKNPQCFISSSKAGRRRCGEGLCAPCGWEMGARTDGDVGPPAQHYTQPCSKAPTVPALRTTFWTTGSFWGIWMKGPQQIPSAWG